MVHGLSLWMGHTATFNQPRHLLTKSFTRNSFFKIINWFRCTAGGKHRKVHVPLTALDKFSRRSRPRDDRSLERPAKLKSSRQNCGALESKTHAPAGVHKISVG